MERKQLYGKTFQTKGEFLKWFEENKDKIDWDEDVELCWFWKKQEQEEN